MGLGISRSLEVRRGSGANVKRSTTGRDLLGRLRRRRLEAACDLLSQHTGAVGSVLVSSKAEQRPFSTIYSDSLGLLMEEYIADGWYLRDARNIGVRRAELQGSFFSNGYVTDLQLFESDE